MSSNQVHSEENTEVCYCEDKGTIIVCSRCGRSVSVVNVTHFP